MTLRPLWLAHLRQYGEPADTRRRLADIARLRRELSIAEECATTHPRTSDDGDPTDPRVVANLTMALLCDVTAEIGRVHDRLVLRAFAAGVIVGGLLVASLLG